MLWLIAGSAAVSLLALVGVGYSLLLSCRAITEANNPHQIAHLRSLVIEYDQQLTELQEKQRAFYARMRKRDKNLGEALAAITPPETSDPDAPAPESLEDLRKRLIASGRLGPRRRA